MSRPGSAQAPQVAPEPVQNGVSSQTNGQLQAQASVKGSDDGSAYMANKDVPKDIESGVDAKAAVIADGSAPDGEANGNGAPPPAELAEKAPEEEETYVSVTYWDIFKQFFIMGWIGFGGPAAHIGLFQKTFVERLKWMSNQVYMELFSLGQCLPGPTSTQVSFALGIVKKGVWGGLLSGVMFQYPGAFMMTAVGAGAANWLIDTPGWLSGIVAGVSAVGVALVASAAKGLLMKMCNTKLLAIIGTLAAGAAIYWVEPWLYPLLIFLGFVITNITERKLDLRLKGNDGGVESLGLGRKTGAAVVAVWLVVLAIVLALARSVYNDGNGPLSWFEVFFRTGSIIYGGGQVVLPMLYGDVVQQDETGKDRPDTWVTTEQFFAGLGVVQAMPGPLFNFSAYLGCIIALKWNYPFILGAVLAWFGLFAPGVMLMFGMLPWWKKFRTWQLYRRGLPGMNSVGVGLILASVFSMVVSVYKISPFPTASLCIGLFAFCAVDELQIFEPLVVLGGALLGLLAWGADLR